MVSEGDGGPEHPGNLSVRRRNSRMTPLPFTRKVFGVGLGRTGTTSLSQALNDIGIKTKHFPFDSTTYEELVSESGPLTILVHYQGMVDGIASFYRQLDRAYPGSKFILTVREKNAWIASRQRQQERLLGVWERLDADLQEFIRLKRYREYGAFELDESMYLEAYDRHIDNVTQYFRNRPDNLLVVDIAGGDGWEKLCPFLAVAVPAKPFPHLHPHVPKRSCHRLP